MPGVEVVDQRRRKRGKKSTEIAACGSLEENFKECCNIEGVELATNVETLGVDLRTRTKQLGAKEKARRKYCDVRFFFIRKNRVFQKKT